MMLLELEQASYRYPNGGSAWTLVRLLSGVAAATP